MNWNYKGIFSSSAVSWAGFYGRRGIKSQAGNPNPSVTVSPSAKELTTHDGLTITATSINTRAYKWQSSRDNITFVDIENENSNELNLFYQHLAGVAGVYYYRVVCIGFTGYVVSDVITVTVTAHAPTVSASAIPTELTAPGSVAFTSTAEFDDTGVKWQHSLDEEVWDDIDGEISETMELDYTADDVGTHYYRCVAIGLGGSTTSEAITITIAMPAPNVTISADKTEVTVPDTVVITAATDYATSQIWQHSLDEEVWDDIADETAETLTIDYTVDDSGTHYYRCVATGLGGCTTSEAVTITITAP